MNFSPRSLSIEFESKGNLFALPFGVFRQLLQDNGSITGQF